MKVGIAALGELTTRALKKKKVETITVLTEVDWQKKRAAPVIPCRPGTHLFELCLYLRSKPRRVP